jgi:2-methylisocitrate lyase-like PEP mutase family enzyme
MTDARDNPGIAGKGAAFNALHARPMPFVVPNPWDAGSARILASFGFEALATTSAGLAFALGRRDGLGLVSRSEALENAGAIARATELPVCADLENGFGHEPAVVAETIRMAADVGLVGASIEDATGNPAQPIYGFEDALERVRAAVAAARALPFPFVLTARAENYLHGRPDLADTVARLRAFAAAGADVVYAPGLPDIDAIATVCAAVAPVPVNVLCGGTSSYSVAELGAAGVRRISVGSAFARAAYGGLLQAAREVRARGTFAFGAEAPSYAQIGAFMDGSPVEMHV